MTTDKCTSNGELEEIIEKLEDVRDSMDEVIEELEDVEAGQRFYRTDAPYGLTPDTEYNGDDRE